MKNNNSNHWSKYWDEGQLTSLPQDFKENYNGAIHSIWLDSFAGLKPNMQVLDLCTGNCAIALLVSEYSDANKLELGITAVDAADISKKNIIRRFPNQKKHLKQINLIANTSVENIALASNKFDLITSQYGIEYCDWELAAGQVFRLLNQGGDFVMIAHAGNTNIVQYMETEELDYNFLRSLKVFEHITLYCKNKINHANLMANLTVIQPKIVKRFNHQPTQLVQSILVMLDNLHNMSQSQLLENLTALHNLVNQHNYAYARLLDLLRVTKSIVKSPEWFKIFIKQGLTLKQHRSVMYNGTINSGTLYWFTK
ncbi:MAG: methyltransferase domain-containing protein [Proteobacteria bacterium]|nr:methyltransferase domain-containing protein [Pseudomonadota bacterium]